LVIDPTIYNFVKINDLVDKAVETNIINEYIAIKDIPVINNKIVLSNEQIKIKKYFSWFH